MGGALAQRRLEKNCALGRQRTQAGGGASGRAQCGIRVQKRGGEWPISSERESWWAADEGNRSQSGKAASRPPLPQGLTHHGAPSDSFYPRLLLLIRPPFRTAVFILFLLLAIALFFLSFSFVDPATPAAEKVWTLAFDTAQHFGHTTHSEPRSKVTQQKVFFWATRPLIHKSVRGGREVAST